jgi:DNA-binding IclR family transcriptional regulator
MTDNTQAQSKDEVSALARGLAVLRAVSLSPTPVSNRELAESTGIPKATVSRLAATLVASGYLRQQADSERFSLGAAVLDMSNAYLRNFDLRSHARLHLAEVAEFAGAAVHLGVRDGLDVVLIDSIRPHSAVILSRLDVGSRMALATSASGRAYLASMEPAQRETALEDIRAAAGKDWPAQKVRIDAALREYAQLGYCTSFGDWHHDIHALGVTVNGPRGELYAVSCGGPAYLLPKKLMRSKIAPRLVEVARAISKEAGSELGG